MTVPYEALNIGARIGAGGQGDVFRVNNRPNEALKIYHDHIAPQLQPGLLDRLVAEADHLSLENHPITYYATWPTETVTRAGKTIGFLMPLLAEDFFLSAGNLTGHEASFMYLAARPAPMWGAVRLPDTHTRLRLLALFAAVLQQLHHRGMIIGDISWSNVLWSPRPRIVLLDCDGIRLPQGQPVLGRQYDSPEWYDPQAPTATPDVDRDRYKLALMVLRVLSHDLTAHPQPSGNHCLEGLDQTMAKAIDQLLVQATQGAHRPSATQWRTVLEGRASHPVSTPLRPSRSLSRQSPPLRQWIPVSRSKK